MQTVIQAVVSGRGSLRDQIVKDARGLESCNLFVERERTPGRSRGWAKLKNDTYPGAINVFWDGTANVLVCRVVNKGRGKPGDIVGDFVAYLLSRQRRRVRQISVWTIK